VNGRMKWSLFGRVLRPGDPVHDALKGAEAPRHRRRYAICQGVR
jgi:hypothetical protein